ncbi:3'-5' exoribonuclease HELZ2-like [Styela clava]
MADIKKIWDDFKKASPSAIVFRCIKCEADVDEQTYRCTKCQQQNKLGIYVQKQDYANQPCRWVRIRERPVNVTDQQLGLCPDKKCQKGSKKCKKGHSDSELLLWQLLREHDLFLSNFLPQLIYLDIDDVTHVVEPTIVQHTPPRKRRDRRYSSNRHTHNNKGLHGDKSNEQKKIEYFLRHECDRGRFFYACEACYKLKPCIVKEMEIGDGKKLRLHCTWCEKSEGLLLYEKITHGNGGVVFYEYEIIGERRSTTRGNSMCRHHLRGTCSKTKCTFAHSYLELQVWKLESRSTSRQWLVNFCKGQAPINRATLDGMFYCDLCCLGFSSHDEYLKYMGQNHVHFPDIKKRTSWIFKKYEVRDFELCSYEENYPPDCNCKNAHSDLELEEWNQRLLLEKARNKFNLTEIPQNYISILQQRIQTERLEEITHLKGVQLKVDETTKDIDIKTEKTKWKLKINITDTNLKLNHVSFPYKYGFEIRHLDQSHYKYHIALDDNIRKNLEFMVLFTNPNSYGKHVGELVFDFNDGQKPVNLLFVVFVHGEGIELPENNLQNNWISDRKIIKHPMLTNQIGKYEKRISELKNEYLPPKVRSDVMDFTDITRINYAEKMHNLLYEEEEARRIVLAKLNIECDLEVLSTGNSEGHVLAKLQLPINVSTDEGLLFKETCCSSVLIGEKDDINAYEAIIISCNESEVLIDISPNCTKNLQLHEGRKLLLQFQLDRSVFCLQHYAIDCLKKKTSLICPAHENYASLNYDSTKLKCKELDDYQSAVFDYLQWQKKDGVHNLNKSYPPLIVAGPFGTGKTHTFKIILIELMKMGEKETTILLCTHSNSAADSYLEDHKFEKWRGKILRLYYHKRRIGTVEESVRKYCLIKNGTFYYPSLKELRKFKLVITTFSAVMALGIETGLEGNVFTHIFLDEASQAMEAEVIMPLTLASLENTRVVIAGDHKQVTQKMYCTSSNQVQTLLERVYEAYENVDKRCRVLLTNNYRCVDGILHLITKIFYKENILKKTGNIQCISGAQSVYFIHIQGECIVTDEGEYVNKEEAFQIMLECKELCEKLKLIEVEDIVVLTADLPQTRLIRGVLRQNGLEDVSVQTVRNVQGQQYKVVILSTVMRRQFCFTGDNFGFLSDVRLLNSALTRAQSMILAVGDAVTLCSTGHCKNQWKIFMRHCEENSAILPPTVNVQSIKREIQIADQVLNLSAIEFTPGLNNDERKEESHNADDHEGEQRNIESNNTQDLSMNGSDDDDDDNDSWCSEDTIEDKILDDMLKRLMGIDSSEITVGIRNHGEEIIHYGETGDFHDEDPNDSGTPLRKSSGNAIYPKYTIQQLEQFLLNDPSKYKRCRINMINWCTAKAVPVDECGKIKSAPVSNISNNENTDNDDDDDDDTSTADEESESESYSGSFGGDSVVENSDAVQPSTSFISPAKISPYISIETRGNLGRTFDKDEVLVKILENRKTAEVQTGTVQKQYGKVLGVLKKRFRNPKDRRFLCRPDEFNTTLMCPIDKKVTKIIIVTPKGHKQSARSKIPIYRPTGKRGQWTDLELSHEVEVSDDKVYVVRFLKWSEYIPYPIGYVEASFPMCDFKKYLKLEYGVPGDHRPGLKSLAKRLKVPTTKQEPIEVFTIDPEKSMDLDDAISLEKCDVDGHNNCFKIGIHITDVASVLLEGSEIDRDAQKRFTTFYGCENEEPIHMLPSELSTSKCSLLPNEVRPAISTFFHSCEKAPHVSGFVPKEPQKVFVKSIKRLSYREAEELLSQNDYVESTDKNLSETLGILWSIMWDWRVSRLNSAAYYTGTSSDAFRAHLLIEEAMITVNANTAAFLSKEGIEFPLRIQAIPDESEWRTWERLCHNLIPNSSYMTSCSKYLKNLKRIEEGAPKENVSEDEDMEGIWEVQTRRRKKNEKRKEDNDHQMPTSIQPLTNICLFDTFWKRMKKCFDERKLENFIFLAACDDFHPSLVSTVERYRGIQKKSEMTSTKNFHFSLRLDRYTWSSSPIRRYIDIIIQRCIHTVLNKHNISSSLHDAIQRICWQYEDRDKQYEKQLCITEKAQTLKAQPEVVQACVTLITDAYMQIALPSMRKYVSRRANELSYAQLTIKQGVAYNDFEDVDEEKKIRTSQGDLILNKYCLVWKFRYYDHSRLGIENVKNMQMTSSVVNIPAQTWNSFVKIISKPPRRSDSEFKKVNFESDIEEAVEKISKEAEPGIPTSHDRMVGDTRNNPKPIKHLREIKWNVTPGSPLIVQMSSSTDKRFLPAPAVQLLRIADNYDVCIEHCRDPVNVYASDATATASRTIKTIDDYQKKWEPLVRMDAANSAVKEGSSITHDGVKIVWRKMKKIADVKNSSFGDSVKSKYCVVNYFDLNDHFCGERYIKFHLGDLLCLRLKGIPATTENEIEDSDVKLSTHTIVLHGIITGVKEPSKESKKLRILFEVPHNHLSEKAKSFAEAKGTRWTIEVIPLSYSHRQMQSTLRNIGNTSDLNKSICLGTIHPAPMTYSEEIEVNIATKRKMKGFRFSLNEEQFKQEQKAIRQNFHLIQGPPGTGKSYLAAHLAAKFAYMNKYSGEGKKVLYCGPSNKSVDVAAGFLKDINRLKVVRMYSIGLEEKLYPNPLKPEEPSLDSEDAKKPNEELKSLALHQLIRNMNQSLDPNAESISQQIREFDTKVKTPGTSFTKKQLDYYQAMVRKAKVIILQSCDIIICTCASSTKLGDYEELSFGQCIIDECAMSCEPETILPLATTEPDQVVLIGDHKQLRPVIKCSTAERLGLSSSLFNRYSEFAGMLTIQYRMHPTIMDFPSRMFYEDRLICDESVLQRPKDKCDPFKWIKNTAAVFWNVKGEEKIQNFKSSEGGEKSKYNMTEVRAVIKLLIRLHTSKIQTHRIMILSPYTAQCARIRENIRRNHSNLQDVHVGTVVTSQGSEADYVILSTVRSLPDSSIISMPNIQWRRKHLGFLIDRNQVNVALTRARRRLIIIGNRDLLQVDELWNNLITAYGRKGAVFERNILEPKQG